MHHQGRLIGHEKRVDCAQLRHIQDKPPSHHTGHSELTKTFNGMGPHSGDTISVPSNRRMDESRVLVLLKKQNKTKNKNRYFQGRCRLYTWYLDAFQFSFRLTILFSHFISTDCI